MRGKAKGITLSFITAAFASTFVFAAPANANDSSTTVVPIVPVAIVPMYDSQSQDTEITIKLNQSIGAADPSTRSTPLPIETRAPQRPSIQATTPVVIPNPTSETGSSENVSLKPVVKAPQISGDTDESSLEVTRVTPQMITEDPETSPQVNSTPSTSNVEPAVAQQLTDPSITMVGPDPIWGYLGYGIVGALAALTAFHVNARRSRMTT
jgi:hypothetical protein